MASPGASVVLTVPVGPVTEHAATGSDSSPELGCDEPTGLFRARGAPSPHNLAPSLILWEHSGPQCLRQAENLVRYGLDQKTDKRTDFH